MLEVWGSCTAASVAVHSDAAGDLRQWLLATAAGVTEGLSLGGSLAGRTFGWADLWLDGSLAGPDGSVGEQR
ncbi:hypothetical protein GCM10029976_076050 [Kribbella albertanoniae]